MKVELILVPGMVFMYRGELAVTRIPVKDIWVCSFRKDLCVFFGAREKDIIEGFEGYEVSEKKRIFIMGPNLNNTQKGQVRTLVANLNSMVRAGWLKHG